MSARDIFDYGFAIAGAVLMIGLAVRIVFALFRAGGSDE